jgi:hypothetical protein
VGESKKVLMVLEVKFILGVETCDSFKVSERFMLESYMVK